MTDTGSLRQLIKPEKVRGVADGERKPICVETQQEETNTSLSESEKLQQQKMKPKSPVRTENIQTYQEYPSKLTNLSNSTGIPKPMAAVKGTAKITSSTTDLSPTRPRFPPPARISFDGDRQKRDDANVALVSPMRTSVVEEVNRNEDEKSINSESGKNMKNEDDELMKVKPMSPFPNEYRIADRSSPHFTHHWYITGTQSTRNIYYKSNFNNSGVNLNKSIDLPAGK